jgi:predicted CXXCH cytochrome family protein
MLQNHRKHSGSLEHAGVNFIMRIFIRSVGLAFFMLLAFLLAATATPQKEQKHSDPSRSCVSSECHPAVMKHKYLHGPLRVKIGQCTVCHAPLPGSDHKFKLVETEEKLCLTCHKRVDPPGYILHDPIAKGKCLVCHDPHGSEQQQHVRKSPAVKLCNECHNKKPVLTKKFPHTPAGRGECLGCHRPHAAKEKKLLDASGRQLCLEKCHEKMRPVTVGGKEQKLHLAAEDCTKCHSSHDSNYPALLTKSPAALCLDGCHKEIKENIESSKFKHDAMTKELACVECHRAHDNKFGGLLRKPETELCFTCHEEVQTQIATAKFKHRPASDKWCIACHLPHGSMYNKLLFAEYPSTTISAYDPAKYSLCFTCHREEMVRERYVDNQTNFRNGRLNLHYLHVNRGNAGHTCRACHIEHASNQPAHIREKVSSGDWVIPIKFTKNKAGGSCLTGCHKEYTYDRANPVQLSAE